MANDLVLGPVVQAFEIQAQVVHIQTSWLGVVKNTAEQTWRILRITVSLQKVFSISGPFTPDRREKQYYVGSFNPW